MMSARILQLITMNLDLSNLPVSLRHYPSLTYRPARFRLMTKNVAKIDSTVTQDWEPLVSSKFPFVAFCFTFLATVMRPKQDVKDMNEHQEMEQYEEGNKWLEEAKQNFDLWFTRQQSEVQTEHQRRVRLAEDILHDISCMLRLSLTFIFLLTGCLCSSPFAENASVCCPLLGHP